MTYSEPEDTSKIELFANKIRGFLHLTIFAKKAPFENGVTWRKFHGASTDLASAVNILWQKSSILDVW